MIGINNNFSGMTPKAQKTKAKIQDHKKQKQKQTIEITLNLKTSSQRGKQRTE
jgi:hypothetical protein